MSKNTINDIPQKEAETRQERLMLGLLDQEAERIQYGRVIIEFGIRAGKIDRLTISETSKTVNIGMRDA